MKKELILSYAEELGINKAIHFFKNKTFVLMYHGISAESSTTNSWLFVREGEFHKQVKYLIDNFEIISIQDALRECTSPRGSKKWRALITFDDGYGNNYLRAYPILKKYHLPAIS